PPKNGAPGLRDIEEIEQTGVERRLKTARIAAIKAFGKALPVGGPRLKIRPHCAAVSLQLVPLAPPRLFSA
ncbi:MAG TPA: hypothetical protein VD994_20635, partial [Prosthecobacter sp.]|nr:hypothetical protein [Prosthecobacter sp.]